MKIPATHWGGWEKKSGDINCPRFLLAKPWPREGCGPKEALELGKSQPRDFQTLP